MAHHKARRRAVSVAGVPLVTRGNGFDSLPLSTDDTVAIRLNLDKGKRIRLSVDTTQLVVQYGIAIAATNTPF